MVQRLEADSYPTLGLIIPVMVRLHRDLSSSSSELKASQRAILQRIPDGTDKSRAIGTVLQFISKLQSNLLERLDPFDTSDANSPFLAATFLLPPFSSFSFFTDDHQRAKSLKAAKKQVVRDMEDVSKKPFVPMWARDEQSLYAQPVPELDDKPDEADSDDDDHKEEVPAAKKQKKNSDAADANDVSYWVGLSGGANPGKGKAAVVNRRQRPSNLSIVEAYMKIDFDRTIIPTDALGLLQQLKNLVHGLSGSIDNTLLVRVALRYFATPASSAPTERIWSSGTNTHTKNRRAFTGDNFSTILYLKSNEHRVQI